MYAIRGLCHRTDNSMGGHGFTIDLHPSWPGLVAKSGIDQEGICRTLDNVGSTWLNTAGFGGMYDPDNSGYGRDPTKPPGPDARPMYRPNLHLSVKWGEWGPEHITVPGNACGLDIDRSMGHLFRGGRSLLPHNVDSLKQKYLLLIVFTEIAESVMLFARASEAAK